MHFNTIQHFRAFSEKTLSRQINVVWEVLGFWKQNLARFNIDLGGVADKGENAEFDKLSHFLKLLDFQILSHQVLTMVVVNVKDF